jgi:cullin-4
LDSALSLFRYIQGKDAFEAYYKRFLAKRLLLDRSSSNDIENHILENLKAECGHEFTKNLENMFNDIQISVDLNSGFRDFEKGTSRMPLYVKVINQAIWPTSPVSDILLPKEMLQSQQLYERFYSSKHKGRRLLWQNSLSTCILVAHFPKGNKDITVTVSQAVILLLFNKKLKIPFTELLQVTNLNEKDLIRLLSSLTIAPYNLIINESGDCTIKRGDKFKYNQDFACASTKLKIPAAQLEQAIEEQKGVEEKVFQNRQHQVDATIVRIMKSKKTCSHNDLIQEIIVQLNYHAEVSVKEERVSFLICIRY